MSLSNRRSVMTLFSGRTDIYSHQVRFLLGEKAIAVDIVNVDPDHKPDDLIDLNPYNSLPTLVDRDLVLYESYIVLEYLDERFPHPPLLPVYPVSRAKARLIIHRMNHDWFSLYDIINSGQDKVIVDAAKEELKDGLLSVADTFAEQQFFMSEEISLIDCYLAPLLWRLPSLGIDLPASGDPLMDYAEKIFEREGFQKSLTDHEYDMR